MLLLQPETDRCTENAERTCWALSVLPHQILTYTVSLYQRLKEICITAYNLCIPLV